MQKYLMMFREKSTQKTLLALTVYQHPINKDINEVNKA